MIMYNLISEVILNNKLLLKFKNIVFNQHYFNLFSVKLQLNNTRTLAPPCGPTTKLYICSVFFILTLQNKNSNFAF